MKPSRTTKSTTNFIESLRNSKVLKSEMSDGSSDDSSTKHDFQAFGCKKEIIKIGSTRYSISNPRNVIPIRK